LKITRTIYLYFAFSFVAAVFLILLVGTTPSQTSPLTFLEKMGITSAFILCCVVGISLTFRSNWIRRYFSQSKRREKNMQSSGERTFRGHHPQCLTFQNHTIHWKEKTWCAGCLGLFIGLCLSILLMILYMITDFQFTKMIALLILLPGLFILLIVYVEILHPSRHATVHVFINSIMPLSFFTITIAVGGITGNLTYGLFTVLLCFLWLDTRIQLSKWHHRFLCTNCPESCKMFTASV